MDKRDKVSGESLQIATVTRCDKNWSIRPFFVFWYVQCSFSESTVGSGHGSWCLPALNPRTGTVKIVYKALAPAPNLSPPPSCHSSLEFLSPTMSLKLPSLQNIVPQQDFPDFKPYIWEGNREVSSIRLSLADGPLDELDMEAINQRNPNLLQPYAAEVTRLSVNIRHSEGPEDLREVLPGFPNNMVNLHTLKIQLRVGELVRQLKPESYLFGKFPPSLVSLKLWHIPLSPFVYQINTLKEFTFAGFESDLDTILEFMKENSSLERVALNILIDFRAPSPQT